MNQLAIDLRDRGIERAITHADAVLPTWSDEAMRYVRIFVSYPLPQQFQGEDIRAYAEKCGLSAPPDKRAWGAIMVRARKAGLIAHAGYTVRNDPKSHRCPSTLWRRA